MPRKKLTFEIIDIPEVHPSLNEWAVKWHHYKRNSEKKRWTEMVGWICKGKKKFDGAVDITIRYIVPNKRRHDIDNYAPKFILDGLVEAGVIKDDCLDIVKSISINIEYEKGVSNSIVLIREHEETH